MQEGHEVHLDRNVRFHGSVYLHSHHGYIMVGADTHFGPNCVLYGPLIIGRKCAVAANVCFAALGHETHPDGNRVDFPTVVKPIIIGDDVWIGANAVIIGGVAIGNHAVVGAGAVVTHDVEAGTTVVGSPARRVTHGSAGGDTGAGRE